MTYNPIKVIHRYKNNNKRTQYIQYIFIGSFIEYEIDNILENIKKKSLFETLTVLSKQKLDKLETVYGSYWYQYFFNRYHIIDQFNSINKNNTKLKQIESKMGKEWTSKHVLITSIKRTEYSFASNYYDYLVARNKIKVQTRTAELDYRTYNIPLIGSGDVSDVIANNIAEEEDSDVIADKEQTFEDLDDEVAEDFDLDELTKLYSMESVEGDKNIKETSKLISDAIHDNSFIKQKDKTELEYNDVLDDIGYDSKLEDVFEKYYIRDQFIFMDDTIKNIRNKICVSIPLSSKFAEDIKLLPEYQYFWTEYNLKNSIDYVMLGQKWIRKNELVKIDIKPNDNLSVYENLRNNLSYLKDSFGIKIKRDDDENNILRDYEEYMMYNEIYMLDIINELGLNYKVESDKKKNIYEVYINIYFPLIPFERFEDIIILLNNNTNKEADINSNMFNIIRNDAQLEKEIKELKAKLN